MTLSCECGCEFDGYLVTACPECSCISKRQASFDEFVPILDDLLEGIKRSIVKHGEWDDYDPPRIFDTIAGEFDEYREAFIAENIRGKHGQVDELMDLAITALKGIRRLSYLQQ